MNIGIYFGSTTGNTESVADLIAESFEEQVSVDYIENLDQNKINKVDLIIFGIPTWNIGQLESTWEDFFPNLDSLDFSNSIIALFGLGDQVSYGDTYLDAMGIIYDKLIEKGVKIIGNWAIDDYEFYESVKNGKFVGLALDIESQDEKTGSRINQWISQIKIEYLNTHEQINVSH